MERLMHGVMDYARQHGGWVFTKLPERLNPSIDWLENWKGDGALAFVTTKADARIAQALKIPLVNLTAHLADPGVPTAMVDHEATGRIAAEHLLERKFRRFGYYGTKGVRYSQMRREGFTEAVTEAGGQCEVLLVPSSFSSASKWEEQEELLDEWLKGMSLPVGVMASTDLRAAMVLEACARVGLRVPEDVAVIGVDNDPVVCESSHPPLSSVSRNDYEVGWRAAELLHRLMDGEAAPNHAVMVGPDTVVARRSTDTLAAEDPMVAKAVKYIGSHLHEAFGVERLVGLVPVSRRRLEQKFRENLGMTPSELITRMRVEKAKGLLEAEP
ncbi:MAG: xylose operon transcription regulator XylR, partial [Verrucomicrobiaceae bacterium]